MAITLYDAVSTFLDVQRSLAASSGCGQTPLVTPGMSRNFTLSSDGIDRTYIVHLPSGYDPNTPAPLILSFHGNNRDAASQEALSRFDNETWNPDGISVYPQGVDDSWQGAPYSAQSVNDTAFVSSLLDKLESSFCIDATRIYAAGKSNGGGFCNVLACTPALSARIAAFAAVSGAFYSDLGADCAPARAVTPIVEFHGSADTTIPYAGGVRHSVRLPGISDWATAWARRNGCEKDVTREEQNASRVTHYTWECSGNATQHWLINGLGHDWPSTTSNSDSKSGTFIDATPIIMDFFRQWSLDG